jgi:hypothetical protein
MDKTVRKYDSLEAMKADEYRLWQRRTPRERLDAAAELSLAAFRPKESPQDVPVRLQRTLVRLPQPEN